MVFQNLFQATKYWYSKLNSGPSVFAVALRTISSDMELGSVRYSFDWRSRGYGFNQHLFFSGIDHEICSSHSLLSADSRRAVVSFWRKNVHKYWLIT